MTVTEAREILLLYRPGTADAEEPQVAEAITVARHSPELAHWFDRHCAFQKAMRAGFRQIQVPEHLKFAVLSTATARPLPAPSRATLWWGAAVACLLLVGLTGLWRRPGATNHYRNFQARMVSTALRDYRMDIQTNDMGQVRGYLASQGAPSDYELPRGLTGLALTGGGALRWRGNPVSMVCFDRGDKEMLFLFVLNRAAVEDPPPEQPRVGQQNEYVAVRWSRGDKTYLLAGPAEADFLKKYF